MFCYISTCDQGFTMHMRPVFCHAPLSHGCLTSQNPTQNALLHTHTHGSAGHKVGLTQLGVRNKQQHQPHTHTHTVGVHSVHAGQASRHHPTRSNTKSTKHMFPSTPSDTRILVPAITFTVHHTCHAGGQALSSTAAFAAIRQAVLAAHKQVLAAEGTLTTLIGALVCRQRWGTGHVLLAVAVGDSPCYVWRAATGCVEEVTHLPPMHGFHR